MCSCIKSESVSNFNGNHFIFSLLKILKYPGYYIHSAIRRTASFPSALRQHGICQIRRELHRFKNLNRIGYFAERKILRALEFYDNVNG
jgi:hypothetical protein